MSEPRKTQGQLDAQIERIRNSYHTAVSRAESGGDIDRLRNRWFNATSAHGNLRGDMKKLDSFADYRPAQRGFTSGEEMKRIDKHFGLSRRNTASLQALRNNVVDYYSNHDNVNSEWMQSITAVIDHHLYNKGGRL